MLAFKAAIFGAALTALGGAGGMRTAPFIAFAAVAAFLYLRAAPYRGAPLLRSFAILIVLSAFFIPFLGRIAPRPLWIIAFSAAFYVLLGIKTLSFARYRSLWIVLDLFLLASAFSAFFLTKGVFSPLPRWTAVLFITFALVRDIFELALPGKADSAVRTSLQKTYALAALLFAVFAAELLWIVEFLPLTLIGSVSMLIGMIFAAIDLFLLYFRKRLSPDRFFRIIAVFAAIAAFAFLL